MYGPARVSKAALLLTTRRNASRSGELAHTVRGQVQLHAHPNATPMPIRALLVTLSLFLAVSAHAQQSVDDCIISGMRGVSSDVAAKMVKQACDRKAYEAVYTAHGAIGAHELKVDGFEFKDGGLVVQVKNTTASTVTVLSLYAQRPEGTKGSCQGGSNSEKFVYKAKLKPDSTLKLQFPSLEMISNGEVCLSATSRLARPSRWDDVSLGRGPVSPIASKDLEAIVDAYSQKLGSRFEP